MSSTATAPVPIRTTVPARLDRLGWSPFHTRMVCGLGAAWILDGLQITIASSVTGVLTQSDTLGHDLDRGRADRVGLPRRRVDRRVGLREDVGPARAQAAVDDHLAVVPVRYRAGGRRHRPSHRLAGVLLRHALRGRDGDRRPVRGDQLGDRRDDAVEVSGTGRHLDQRHLLGRRDPRLVRLADLPQRLQCERRLAAGVPDGPGAGDGGHRRGPGPAREPAVVDDPRPPRGGRGRTGQDRGGAGQAARARRTILRRSSSHRRSSTGT